MIKIDFQKIIDEKSSKYEIDPYLFSGIVNAESEGNPSAIRYEPNYKYLWRHNHFAALLHTTIETEEALQRMSYGLCQLIGANARMLDFSGPLTDLLDPELNIEYGTMFFKERCDIHPQIKDKISSYNAGSPIKKETGEYINAPYVDKVYAYFCEAKGLKA